MDFTTTSRMYIQYMCASLLHAQKVPNAPIPCFLPGSSEWKQSHAKLRQFPPRLHSREVSSRACLGACQAREASSRAWFARAVSTRAMLTLIDYPVIRMVDGWIYRKCSMTDNVLFHTTQVQNQQLSGLAKSELHHKESSRLRNETRLANKLGLIIQKWCLQKHDNAINVKIMLK